MQFKTFCECRQLVCIKVIEKLTQEQYHFRFSCRNPLYVSCLAVKNDIVRPSVFFQFQT